MMTIVFLTVCIALFTGVLKTLAQCPDIQVSIPTTDDLNVTVPTDPGVSVTIPTTPGTQIDNTCDGIVITVPVPPNPGGQTGGTPIPFPTVVVNMVALFVVNGRNIDLPASMDPLPFEVSLPNGGTIAFKKAKGSGPAKYMIIVQGDNATSRPKKPILMAPIAE
jgi:hypothetical protein